MKEYQKIIKNNNREYVGNCLGFLSKINEDFWIDYLKKFDSSCSKEIILRNIYSLSKNKKKIENISFLTDLLVSENLRNKGYGNDMVFEFIEESIKLNADIILLIPKSKHKNNFDLVNWYESYGFEKIKINNETEIMILFLN